MDRLTQRDINGIPFCQNAGYLDMLQRLAAYEDTGLEPDEVQEIAWRAEAVAAMNDHLMSQPNRYEQAEIEGRLIVLPCKVGNTVYKVWYDQCHNGELHPDSYDCSGCEDVCDIKKSIHEMKAPSVEWIFRYLRNGSSVYFLTREEAEAALGGDHDAQS